MRDDRGGNPLTRKDPVRHVLVIRFGALGDLCLLARTLARAGGSGGRRVTLVTKGVFAPLLARSAGVDEVVALPDGGPGGLLRLAGRLRHRPWDAVVDAHGVLRSHVLLGLLGRRATARLAKDTTDRLRLLRGGAPGSRLDRTMGDRFDELLPAITGAGPVAGESATGALPFAGLRPADLSPQGLGLAPGARWNTKRWPADRFAELLDMATAARRPIRVFLGPQEETWWDDSPLAAAAGRAGAKLVRRRPLVDIATEMARCAALVTNDSGLLHLAEGVGTPVVALFGPTVRAFGYFPVLPASRVLETYLDCRPCSRNGKRPCHRGDLACLADISAAEVWEAVGPLLTVSGEAP